MYHPNVYISFHKKFILICKKTEQIFHRWRAGWRSARSCLSRIQVWERSGTRNCAANWAPPVADTPGTDANPQWQSEHCEQPVQI